MLKYAALICLFIHPILARVDHADSITACSTSVAAARYSKMIHSNHDLYQQYQSYLVTVNDFCQTLLPLVGNDSTEAGRALIKFMQVPGLFQTFSDSIFGERPEKLLHIVGSGDYVRNTLTDAISALDRLVSDPRCKEHETKLRLTVTQLLQILQTISLDTTILRDLYEQPLSSTCDLTTHLPLMGFAKPVASYKRQTP